MEPEDEMITTSNTVNYPNETSVGAKAQSTRKDNLGKDDFMSLFVTQLQNQNPLEPMENTEFLSQMAQFSSLEQMQNVASAMELLTLSQSASTNSQMISLIGKRIIHPGNAFTQEQGQKVELMFNVPEDSPPLKMNILNDKGDIVRTIESTDIKSGFNRYEFDGLDQSGTPLTSGLYQYQFVRADGKTDAVSVESFSNLLVDSVAFGSDSTMLKSCGLSIPLADILEVRANSQEQGG
jgi:flagellar basal-body rod modification protein FlgD